MTTVSADETYEQIVEEINAMKAVDDLRRSLDYLRLLQGDIDRFEKMLDRTASDKKKRTEFQHLMTLALGSGSSWDRLYKVSGILQISPSAVTRYMLRSSAPVPMIFTLVINALRSVIAEEYAEVESAVLPLEQIEQSKRESQRTAWEEFRARVETVVPGDSFNCNIRFNGLAENAEVENIPLELMFAYPCRGIYPLSDHYPLVCSVCEKEGKEHSHTHGRVILSSEDGLMLLPHIVRSQADLLQVVEDMRDADTKKNLFLQSDNPTWFNECKQFLLSNQVVGSLPSGNAEDVESRDLTQESSGWFS